MEVIVAVAVVEVIVSILVGIVTVPPLQLLIFKFSRLSRKLEIGVSEVIVAVVVVVVYLINYQDFYYHFYPCFYNNYYYY